MVSVAGIDPLESFLDAEEPRYYSMKPCRNCLTSCPTAMPRGPGIPVLVEEISTERFGPTELILRPRFPPLPADPKRWIAETANRFATQNRASRNGR
jgi:hypothetical protein